jgi:hypothetical protein
MTDTSTPTNPIDVKPHMAPVVMSESTKLVMIALFAAAADHFLHSDIAIGAVVACGGVLATALWGLWTRVHNWRALRFLANLAPSEVATVGGK